MKHRLLLKEEATRDVQQAVNFYESQRIGLGIEFLHELKTYLDKITENPGMFRTIESKQFANLRRFPFKIVFQVRGDLITVFSIFHHSRNPGKLY